MSSWQKLTSIVLGLSDWQNGEKGMTAFISHRLWSNYPSNSCLPLGSPRFPCWVCKSLSQLVLSICTAYMHSVGSSAVVLEGWSCQWARVSRHGWAEGVARLKLGFSNSDPVKKNPLRYAQLLGFYDRMFCLVGESRVLVCDFTSTNSSLIKLG